MTKLSRRAAFAVCIASVVTFLSAAVAAPAHGTLRTVLWLSSAAVLAVLLGWIAARPGQRHDGA